MTRTFVFGLGIVGLIVLGVGCVEESILTPPPEEDQVRMEIRGGLAGFHRVIEIHTTPEGVVLTDRSERMGRSLQKILPPESYDQLWQTLEANDAFTLKDNTELTGELMDGIFYTVALKRGDRQHRFEVYAPEALRSSRKEPRYARIVQAIRALADQETPQPSMFLLPDDANTRARRTEVWEAARRDPAVQRVLDMADPQVLIHFHPFSVGMFDPNTAEWVVLVTARPQPPDDLVSTAIVRLDYQTLQFKRGYDLRGPMAPVDAVAASAVMSQNPPYPWMERWQVAPEQLKRMGDFWTFSWPAGDFGGTMIVHANTGKLVYSATTVWNGRGNHLVP